VPKEKGNGCLMHNALLYDSTGGEGEGRRVPFSPREEKGGEKKKKEKTRRLPDTGRGEFKSNALKEEKR